MFVIKVVIVNYGQMIIFFFFYKIEWVNVVPRILNLEGHQNCMIGSKVKTILTLFFVHDWLGLFGSETSLLWIIGESAGEGLLLLPLVTGGKWPVTWDKWHMTCDKWHMTCHMSHMRCDLWHMTHDFFKKCQKCQKSNKKCQKFWICWQKSAQNSKIVSKGVIS